MALVKKPTLDVYCLGDKWPKQLRLDLLKYVPGVVLHPASWKLDTSTMRSNWWCYFYDCESVSKSILEILSILVDPTLRDVKTGKRYNGFTFFLLDERNTSEIYYSTRLIHKDIPVDMETLIPSVDTGFERILDGWVYTTNIGLSLHRY